MENKNSFFSIKLDITNIKTNSFRLEQLENQIDLVLSNMHVSQFWHKFTGANEIIYFFKTDNRKRKGQLVKVCDNILNTDQSYYVEAMTKMSYEQDLERMRRNDNFRNVHKPSIFSDYAGNDIKFFDDPKNWHKWQTDVYNMLLDENDQFKTPHARKIIHLYCKTGNSGKSSFFKWLYYKHPEEIGRIGYGQAHQLRSSTVNIGRKLCYIIDLARTKSRNDNQEDLLSIVEDLKSGFVSNPMFGSGRILMMEPPFVILSSNYLFNYDSLSEDRWEVYEITKKKTLRAMNKKELKPKEVGRLTHQGKK